MNRATGQPEANALETDTWGEGEADAAASTADARLHLITSETLSNTHLKRAQGLHATGVAVFTTLGLLAAVALVHWSRIPTWAEVVFYILWTVLIAMGSAIGYHRHFTHRSFKAAVPVRVTLAILGSMASQGPVIFWTALHRRHHQCSDKKGDPHSPYVNEHGEPHPGFWRGLWYAYMGWTFDHEVPNAAHYARDLIRDKHISRINQQYFLWVAIGLLVPATVGFALQGSWVGALSGFVWGGLVRILFWHNMIWYITSLAHVIGRRDYLSSDQSTNSLLMALPTLGESWHNNHHAFPTAALVGFEWWQIDICGWVIRALEKLGLVWDVMRPTQAQRDSKRVHPTTLPPTTA
jgi:stearoyl-CoA desaturase (Delta-9 desaturase)